MRKRILFVGLLIELSIAVCFGRSVSAGDAACSGVKLADTKGKQSDARLIFSDTNKTLVVTVADRAVVSIPCDQLDKFSYEYTKKHRITQGAVLMEASLAAGAIVMLTKPKSHWLYIDVHEQDVPKSLVLCMDKERVLEDFRRREVSYRQGSGICGGAKNKLKKNAKVEQKQRNN